MINPTEMEAMERDILSIYRDFSILRHENQFAVKPEEFHEKVVAKMEEVLMAAKQIEEEGKRRAF